MVVAVVVVLFLLISAFLSRWLGTENAEREAVLDVLQAQARGDANRMLRDIDCQDDACVARVRANARELRAPGDVTIVRHRLRDLARADRARRARRASSGSRRAGSRPCSASSCERTGTPLSGQSVTLLDLSAPIGRQAACS